MLKINLGNDVTCI